LRLGGISKETVHLPGSSRVFSCFGRGGFTRYLFAKQAIALNPPVQIFRVGFTRYLFAKQVIALNLPVQIFKLNIKIYKL
jgi:hypothetical protein